MPSRHLCRCRRRARRFLLLRAKFLGGEYFFKDVAGILVAHASLTKLRARRRRGGVDCVSDSALVNLTCPLLKRNAFAASLSTPTPRAPFCLRAKLLLGGEYFFKDVAGILVADAPLRKRHARRLGGGVDHVSDYVLVNLTCPL
jgi:hypothetical protein